MVPVQLFDLGAFDDSFFVDLVEIAEGIHRIYR